MPTAGQQAFPVPQRIGEPPNDNAVYGRVNGAWIVLSPALTLTGDVTDTEVGATYTVTLTIAGGKSPYTIDTETLPAGLDAAVVGSTVEITGTPTTFGAFDYTVTVADSYGVTASVTGEMDVMPYPVDEAGGDAPQFAYGTKLLVSGYEGAAIRVIRASDSTESDIGFVGQDLDVATLETFLSGTTGKVVTSYDQSGNDNHRVQTDNALRPSVGFATIGGTPTIYMRDAILPFPALMSTDRQLCDFYGVSQLHGTRGRSTLLLLGTSVICRTLPTATTGQLHLSPSGPINSLPPQTQPSLFEARWTASSRSVAQNGYSASGAAGTPGTQTGGSMGAAAGASQFNEACAIGYSRTLADADRTALRDSLNTLYGIAPTATASVIYEGDSITAGGSSGDQYDNYASQVANLLDTPVNLYKVAQSGFEAADLVVEATYDAAVGAVLGALTGNRIVFLSVGTNDLSRGGTAAQLYADTQTYAGLVRADGGKIIVCTLLPDASWTAGEQSSWADFNALLRAGWASFADGLCDFAADPTMGPFAAASDASLYPDGLHPSWLGHSHLAPVAAAAIGALL